MNDDDNRNNSQPDRNNSQPDRNSSQPDRNNSQPDRNNSQPRRDKSHPLHRLQVWDFSRLEIPAISSSKCVISPKRFNKRGEFSYAIALSE